MPLRPTRSASCTTTTYQECFLCHYDLPGVPHVPPRPTKSVSCATTTFQECLMCHHDLLGVFSVPL